MAGLVVKYSLLAFPVASAGLGVWQIRRLEWKKKLLADLDAQILQEPVDLTSIENAEDLSNMEYRRVRASGRYDPDPSHQLFLKPRILIVNEEALLRGRTAHQSNNGVNVITPFRIDDSGRRILVNRGWLPLKGDENYKEHAHVGLEASESQELVGVVRKSDKKSTYGINNDVTSREWHIRDIESMARVLGTEPIFIDAVQKTSRTTGPIGGQTQLNVRNEHLNYAITWFSLAALTLVMWYSRYGRRGAIKARGG